MRLSSRAASGRRLWFGLLVVLFLILGAACALGEHLLELRDAARLTASETFYSVQGRRIRYHLTGTGSRGPTLVLLNGISGSLEQWDKVQSLLSAGSPVLSYDRSGGGFSDAAEAHDAYADAAELEQLLRAPQIARPPYILVGFSSSALMEIVFAARHLDVVKGIIFVDPILGVRGTGTPWKSYRRIFWRPSLVNPIQAFFGYKRLKSVLAARDAPSSDANSERWNAIIVSTHHWVASTRDAFGLDEAAEQAEALMAARPFADLPLGVLITDPPDDYGFLEPQQELVTRRSDRGIIRAVPYEHSQLLEEPGAIAALADLIHAVANQERPQAAFSVGAP